MIKVENVGRAIMICKIMLDTFKCKFRLFILEIRAEMLFSTEDFFFLP